MSYHKGRCAQADGFDCDCTPKTMTDAARIAQLTAELAEARSSRNEWERRALDRNKSIDDLDRQCDAVTRQRDITRSEEARLTAELATANAGFAAAVAALRKLKCGDCGRWIGNDRFCVKCNSCVAAIAIVADADNATTGEAWHEVAKLPDLLENMAFAAKQMSNPVRESAFYQAANMVRKALAKVDTRRGGGR